MSRTLYFQLPKTKRVINFGPILTTPWVIGFRGEAQWFFPYFWAQGMTFKDMTPAFKTVTLDPHTGNTVLNKNGRPKKLIDPFVFLDQQKGFITNAWGLSNPGLDYCIRYWKKEKAPFVVSVVSLKTESVKERLEEIQIIARKLRDMYNETQVPFAIQFNAGCPTAGAHNKSSKGDIIYEAIETALALKNITRLPIIYNCSPVTPLDLLLKICGHWDALWIGNTIPFGHEFEPGQPSIDWTTLTPNGESPLNKRGLKPKGGFSGHAATRITGHLIELLDNSGVDLPIIASNSIRTPDDVDYFFGSTSYKVKAVAMGSIAFTNPGQMRACTLRAHQWASGEVL